MAINLNALALDEAVATAHFQGQEASVTYRPSAITTHRLQELQRAAVEDDMGAIIDFLVDVMSDWDVTRGKTKVTIDKEGLENIPMVFLRAIMVAVMEDSTAGEE